MANSPQNNPYAPDPTLDSLHILSWGTSYADWTDAINHAVTQITNASRNPTLQGTIYFSPRTYTLQTSCTIPDGVKIYLEKGAVLSVASGKTLTVNGGYEGSGSFAGAGTVVLKNIEQIDVRDFGIKLNDTSNAYGAEFQRAITAAGAVTYGSGTVSRGAILLIPPSYIRIDQTISLEDCRGLRILGGNYKPGSSYWSQSTLKGTMTDAALFDLGSSNNDNITFEKLTLAGSQGNTSGADLNNHAIYGTSANSIRLKDLNIHGWGGSAIRLDAGSDTTIEHVQATGCLWGYGALAAPTGVLHLEGGECYIDECNFNGTFAFTTGNYTSGNYAAAYIDAGPMRIMNGNAAFAEVGWHFGMGLGNSPSLITNTRGEFNQGHGFWIEGNELHFTNCSAYANSLAADATYSGFYSKKGASGNVIKNTFTNCQVGAASSVGGNSNKMLYGFEEDNFGAANTYVFQTRYDRNCRIASNIAAAGGTFSWATASTNIIPSTEAHDWEQQLTGVTSLSFYGDQGNNWRATINANTATEITATNLIPGQIYKLLVINHSGGPTISLNSTVFPHHNFVSPAASKWLTYQFMATIISNVTRLVQLGGSSGDMS